jgi:hypothetical protein
MNAQELIYNMLTENTGSHMLDSGGAYGRNWERNQVKTMQDFENEPEEVYTYSKRWNELSRTVSVYHYLSQLQTDRVCDKFNAMPCEDWDAEDVYGVSKAQWEWLNEFFHDLKVTHTFNTYNFDSDLSQILQGSWIEGYRPRRAGYAVGVERYLLLQIHGGCDARGGYTNAKLFLPPDYGIINEYLDEYKDSYSIDEDLEHGYITAVDYDDPTITYTSEEILQLFFNHLYNSVFEDTKK